MTKPRRGLNDPEYAAFAWARYRRLMLWMALVAAAAVAIALLWLRSAVGGLPLPIVIATVAGIGLSMLLAAALMGLVFLSSGTGHDEDTTTFEDKE